MLRPRLKHPGNKRGRAGTQASRQLPPDNARWDRAGPSVQKTRGAGRWEAWYRASVPPCTGGRGRADDTPHKWTHLFQLTSWGNTRPNRRVQSSVGS